MYKLAQIVLPTSELFDYSDMFFRINKREHFNGSALPVKIISFDTWFNVFFSKIWHTYCDIGTLFLSLRIKGEGIVQAVGSVRDPLYGENKRVLSEHAFKSDEGEDIILEILDAEKYDCIYFRLILSGKHNPFCLISGSWRSERTPQRNQKIAVVICTYKREHFILKNIALFKQFVQYNPDVGHKLKLLVVDNGRTLNTESGDASVRIVHNQNAGGAGGFTRGLMEALASGEDFTRVIFMDDDVEIVPEAFFRTITLAEYLKDRYNDAFISGSMFDLYRKNILIEQLSITENSVLRPYYSFLDMSKYENILKVCNVIPDDVFTENKIHSAWWYCCFPLAFVREKGLPLPVFFRGDDIEWSWRHQGKTHIAINGVFIWHLPFPWRTSKLTQCYYIHRNMFLLNCLYNDKYKKQFSRYFIGQFKYLFQTYDYVGMDMFLHMMDDILKGSAAFKENPDEQLKDMNKNYKATYHDSADPGILERVLTYLRTVSPWKRTLYRLTLYGALYPASLMPVKKDWDIAKEYMPAVEHFMLTPEVRVYNPFTMKYEIRRHDKKELVRRCVSFFQKLYMIRKRFDVLKSDFQKARKEQFITMEFWRHYLKIDA